MINSYFPERSPLLPFKKTDSSSLSQRAAHEREMNPSEPLRMCEIDDFFDNFDKFVSVRFICPFSEEDKSTVEAATRSLLEDFETAKQCKTDRPSSSQHNQSTFAKHLKSKTSSFEWFNESKKTAAETINQPEQQLQPQHSRQPSLASSPILKTQLLKKTSTELGFVSPKPFSLNLHRISNSSIQQNSATTAIYLPIKLVNNTGSNQHTITVVPKNENIFQHPKIPRKLSQFSLDPSQVIANSCSSNGFNKENTHPNTYREQRSSLQPMNQPRQRVNEVHIQHSKAELMRKLEVQLTSSRNLSDTFNSSSLATTQRGTILAQPPTPTPQFSSNSALSTPDWSSQSTQAQTITISNVSQENLHEEPQSQPPKQIQKSTTTVAQQLRERVRVYLANHNDKRPVLPPQTNNVKQAWTVQTFRRHTAQISFAAPFTQVPTNNTKKLLPSETPLSHRASLTLAADSIPKRDIQKIR